MKLNSAYFDRIRIKADKQARQDQVPECDWPQCCEHGRYPAPKGRGHEGEYHRFCLDHVRAYNKSYNYFAGMSDRDVMSWQRHAVTGHRPTWPLGQNSWAMHNGGRRQAQTGRSTRVDDPYDLFGADAVGGAQTRPRRPIRAAELTALHSLGLDETATPDQVKSQYKTLVKRLHPDANGGSRANEDKLREIIQAYDRLRTAGFC